ncbi:MAG: hypothetical protein H6625_12210 [Bdellovibrionaceae bacterium]|nr:hypothetical protein [Pseudobdellovibrionaceae bacterium]
MKMCIVKSLVLMVFVSSAVVAKAYSNKFEIQWNNARQLILKNNVSDAITILKKLQSNKQQLSKVNIDINQIHLTLGRAYYQLGKMAEALTQYNLVEKSSDFWPEAVEEKAWAYVVMKKEDKALAQLETLMTPIFDQVIGPEPYFLKALIHLRICDYYGVLKTTEHFKKRYITRIQKLQDLVKVKGLTPETKVLIEMATKGQLNLDFITKNLVSFPYMFHRDVNLQGYFDKLPKVKDQAKVASNMANRIAIRLKFLAKRNLKEIEKNLNLIHVIEAEVIQRVHIAGHPDKKYRNELSFKGSQWMSFPISNDEIWVDEIDKFHVQVKSCPTKNERKSWASK